MSSHGNGAYPLAGSDTVPPTSSSYWAVDGLLRSGGRVCLTAYCHIDGIEKTYRVDRIREVRIEGP